MRIAIYGAGGYTGRLVAAEVIGRGAEAVLVGRGRERLEATVAAAGGGEVRVGTLDDPSGLVAAIADCDAIVNCAGPFTTLGEPVVQAAIAAGIHYVDTTAEQLYVERIFARCGE